VSNHVQQMVAHHNICRSRSRVCHSLSTMSTLFSRACDYGERMAEALKRKPGDDEWKLKLWGKAQDLLIEGKANKTDWLAVIDYWNLVGFIPTDEDCNMFKELLARQADDVPKVGLHRKRSTARWLQASKLIQQIYCIAVANRA
jgi:hypothetical protein